MTLFKYKLNGETFYRATTQKEYRELQTILLADLLKISGEDKLIRVLYMEPDKQLFSIQEIYSYNIDYHYKFLFYNKKNLHILEIPDGPQQAFNEAIKALLNEDILYPGFKTENVFLAPFTFPISNMSNTEKHPYIGVLYSISFYKFLKELKNEKDVHGEVISSVQDIGLNFTNKLSLLEESNKILLDYQYRVFR